ncbi:MAG: BamA/TamA family outer membrane protein [Saprospiraceae bacterium]|nr:BamA/TamA family outer membrane protein [Saprospiraceae bacterium]
MNQINKKNTSYRGILPSYVCFLFVLLLLSSCQTSRYLGPNDKLLRENKILFKSKTNNSDQKILAGELEQILIQKPNERILYLIPREWVYLVNAQKGDTTSLDKGLRNIGQKPVFYDESISSATSEEMMKFLRNDRGYFDAEVDYSIDEKSGVRSHKNSFGTYISTYNKVTVNYIIDLKERYTIHTINYVCADTGIMKIIQQNLQSSHVKKGDYYNSGNFNLEKSRLTLDLQNRGYINFNTNFIDIVADSNKTTKSIDFWFEIAPPANAQKHLSYRIGEVVVYPDFYKEFEQIPYKTKKDTLGLGLLFHGKKSLVKPSVLRKSIFFQEGEKYTFENRQKTFRKLNSLTPYRFVNITASPRTDQDSIIDVNIYLTPQEKKYILESDLEGYYSSFDVFNLLGMSVSGNLVNRNFLKGAENLSVRGQFGFGLNIGRGENNQRVFNLQSRNISLNSNLQFPSHVDFLGLSKFVNRVGLIPDRFFNNFDSEAKTNISLGFTSLKFFNFYGFNSLNAAFGYEYTSPKGHRYIFRPMGINFDQYSILDTTEFLNLPIIFLQFRDVLGTGFFFRDFTHIYNGVKNKKGRSFVLINKLEFSGLEVDLFNRLYNVVTNSNKDWKISLPNDKKIDFAKYIKYEFDFRYHMEFSKKHSLAFRFNSGVAIPFNKDRVVPFIKQYGLGGPNSLRAWNIRQVGPGGYVDPLYKLEPPSDLNIFIQQGDMKIETNVEYRFNIFLFLDGALFVDAGNVWNLKASNDLPNAHITSDFLDQVAIAAGYGIRLNFVFFNIRFDTGYRIRSPYQYKVSQMNWFTLNKILNQGIGNIQVGVNFPF